MATRVTQPGFSIPDKSDQLENALSIAHSTKKVDAGRIPGPAAVPNCVEVAVRWTGANSKIFTSFFHGSFTGAFTPSVAIANSLFSAISTGWSTNLASFSPTGTNILGCTIRDMTSPANPIYQSSAAAVAGSSASPAMPVSVALVLTENVNIRGRGAKGRVYVPNWATNADAGGGIAAAGVQTGMNLFGTAVFNALTAQSLTPCVAKVARQAYIGYSGASHTARAATTTSIVNYTCRDLFWDTQRRRIQL